MKANIRIVLAVVLLQIFSLLLQGFLDVYKYSTLLADLVRSRLEIVALDVKSNLEATVALGMALNETNNADAMIKRMLAQETLIQQIVIFEVSGSNSVVVYDTSNKLKSAVDHRWHVLNMKAGDNPWGYEESDDTQIVGAPIQNNLGQTIGGIAIRFESSLLRIRYEGIVQAMIKAIIPILILAVSFCLLLTLLVLNRLNAAVQTINQMVDVDGNLTINPYATSGTSSFARIPEVIAALQESENELKRPGQA